MVHRVSQRLRKVVLVLVMFCLTPFSVWAGSFGRDSYAQTFFAHLDGFDYRGCRQWDLGTDAEFNAIINTRRGNFNGTSKGVVTNQSRCYQWAFDVGTIYGLDIRHSYYEVDWKGRAFFIACGNAFTEP